MKKQYVYSTCFFLLYLIYQFYMNDLSSLKDGYDYISLIFGNIEFSQDRDLFWQISLWILPRIPLILIFGDYFELYVKKNYSLLLYRYYDKRVFFFRSTLSLLKKSIFYILILISIGVISGVIYKHELWTLDCIMIIEIVNVFLYMIFFVIIINQFSLFIKPIFVALIMLFIEVVQVFLVMGNGFMIKILPVACILQKTRDNPTIAESLEVGGVLLCWGFISFFVAWIFFKKRLDYI